MGRPRVTAREMRDIGVTDAFGGQQRVPEDVRNDQSQAATVMRCNPESEFHRGSAFESVDRSSAASQGTSDLVTLYVAAVPVQKRLLKLCSPSKTG